MDAADLVRLATPGDVAGIAALSRDQIEHGLPWRWSPERVTRCLRDRNTNVAVASEDRRLLGFGIMQYADMEAHLLLFAVNPACRRRRVGTAILGWLEAVASESGARRVLLECRRDNATARDFYCTLGYHERVIVQRRYEGREDGIRLEKWLSVEPPDA
jgi:[ribosomal protein S18]-alanine N-acetyltransferase